MPAYQLISVQVGQPTTYPPARPGGKPWRSAIDKRPVTGAVWVRALGLDGDAQVDRKNHGGPFRAVNAYPSEHYDFWRATPGLETMTGGAFGENFTTRGLLETDTCIGDVFKVGEVVVTVTQPRGPCNTLNKRWQSTTLMNRAIDTVRMGWYLRVLTEGRVQAGDPLERLEHPFPEFTVARVWSLMTDRSTDPADVDARRRLAECPGLSDDVRAELAAKQV